MEGFGPREGIRGWRAGWAGAREVWILEHVIWSSAGGFWRREWTHRNYWKPKASLGALTSFQTSAGCRRETEVSWQAQWLPGFNLKSRRFPGLCHWTRSIIRPSPHPSISRTVMLPFQLGDLELWAVKFYSEGNGKGSRGPGWLFAPSGRACLRAHRSLQMRQKGPEKTLHWDWIALEIRPSNGLTVELRRPTQPLAPVPAGPCVGFPALLALLFSCPAGAVETPPLRPLWTFQHLWTWKFFDENLVFFTFPKSPQY